SLIRSQVKPMRLSAPGAKFSTSTSHCLTRASRIALPFGFLASTVIERLLALSIVKYRLSTPGMSRSWPRVTSPSPARSTLMTSAPSHASRCVHGGPACTRVKSRMRTPSSALPISATSQVNHRAHREHRGQCEGLLGGLGGGSNETLSLLLSLFFRYFFRTALCGLSLPMLPLSVPAAGSITALTRVGLPESIALFTAWLNSSGVVTWTPPPPKASIILS